MTGWMFTVRKLVRLLRVSKGTYPMGSEVYKDVQLIATPIRDQQSRHVWSWHAKTWIKYVSGQLLRSAPTLLRSCSK